MTAEEAQVARDLLQRDDYRQLVEEHHRLDHRIHELSDRPHLSTPEQIEETALKKMKLQIKDRMADIARHHARNHSS